MQYSNSYVDKINGKIFDFVMLVVLTENVVFHFSIVILAKKLQEPEYVA